MEQKQMQALIAAARSQGIDVTTPRKGGEFTVFSTYGVWPETGKRFTVYAIISIELPFPAAVMRLRQNVGLMWLSPE